MGAPISYRLDTEIPPAYFGKLFEFIYGQYLATQKQRFSGIVKRISPEGNQLSYKVLDKQGKGIIAVEVSGTKTVDITVTPLNAQVLEDAVVEARQDVVIATQLFEEKARKATWYFAWREGEEIVPEKVKTSEKSFQRLFLETQMLLFAVFIVFGMGFFFVVYTFLPQWFWVAPIALIAAQFVFVFYSSKVISKTSDWTITKENPYIHILEYHLPLGTIDQSKPRLDPKQTADLKRQVYREIIAKHGAINCSDAQKVFGKYDVTCQADKLVAKKINVYELVKRVADKFGYPVPKIVVSNTLVPNAAASGPSPSRGIVLITTGLLVQLEEPEIISVLGHEFGHLKGKDPLILYGLTSAEFLFRFYILIALFPGLFLFLVYFWAVMTFIFFIAKFFEARADITSAIIMGQPKVLASALEKIGFQRLLFERAPAFRIQEWVGLDSHPPIYFRVKRLEQLEEPVNIKHPLIASIKAVVQGFRQTLNL
ncbi:MAG: M56 family metallopeptidase [Candidatus Bathyarchaeota archaeon]|nr:M56 family metallopeptidase [Candidatus Bathyarchaeota archaeon]